MARLGRGRREGARIRRNASTPTPTPLVRKRLTQTPNGNDRAAIVGRVWRRKRARILLRAPQSGPKVQPARQPLVSRADVRASSRTRFFQQRSARISRAQSIPTPTPLVRKRLTQTPNGNDRAMVVARVWRRKRARIVVRAPQPGPQIQPAHQPAVSRAGLRASVRGRGFQPRGARIVRAASTPTPTPFVKPVVVLGRQRARSARVRAFFVRHPATLSRPPIVATVPFVRHAKPVASSASRSARVRSRRRRPIVLRAPVAQTRVQQPIVSRDASRAAQVRARARHRARIVRAPIVPVAAARPPAPVVRRTRASVRVRYTRPRSATIVRPSFIATTTAGSKPKLVVGRNNRKAALTRSYLARRRYHLETSTLGAAGAVPPITTVTQATGATGRTLAGGSTGRTLAGGETGRTLAGGATGRTAATTSGSRTRSELED